MQALSPHYGLTPKEQQQEYSDISASTSAAVNQDSKQIADAAGSSLFAQDAPLTDNLQLLDPEIQLQNINVDLNAVPLSSLPPVSSSLGSEGAQSNTPGEPMLPEVLYNGAPRGYNSAIDFTSNEFTAISQGGIG